jgi:hypothetical protein
VVGVLQECFDEVKSEIGDDLSYLGMRLRFGGGKVLVSMEGYITTMLDGYGMVPSRKSAAAQKLFTITEMQEVDEQTRKRLRFHRTTAQLLYVSQRARPDVQLAASFLCTRVRCPTREDVEKLERI